MLSNEQLATAVEANRELSSNLGMIIPALMKYLGSEHYLNIEVGKDLEAEPDLLQAVKYIEKSIGENNPQLLTRLTTIRDIELWISKISNDYLGKNLIIPAVVELERLCAALNNNLTILRQYKLQADENINEEISNPKQTAIQFYKELLKRLQEIIEHLMAFEIYTTKPFLDELDKLQPGQD